MTPVIYDLNQPSSSFPFVELKEDQHLQLFLSPYDHHHHVAAAISSSGPTSFNPTQDQRGSTKFIGESSHHYDHEMRKVGEHIPDSVSSDHRPFSSYSSSFPASVNDKIEAHKLSSSSCKGDDKDYYEGSDTDGLEKWMPSKMRIMQKITNSNCSESDTKPVKFTLKFQDHQHYHANNTELNSSCSNSNSNSNIRVCSDCNTTTTPLWRSGPRGPKSLCNACGIRQRKARRAMAAAAAAAENGTAIAMETSSAKSKVKEKKSRTSHVAQCKKVVCKPHDHPPHHQHHHQGQKTKICFKNLALSLSKNSALQRVLPQDVEEAAILLMELSCGFIHS